MHDAGIAQEVLQEKLQRVRKESGKLTDWPLQLPPRRSSFLSILDFLWQRSACKFSRVLVVRLAALLLGTHELVGDVVKNFNPTDFASPIAFLEMASKSATGVAVGGGGESVGAPNWIVGN